MGRLVGKMGGEHAKMHERGTEKKNQIGSCCSSFPPIPDLTALNAIVLSASTTVLLVAKSGVGTDCSGAGAAGTGRGRRGSLFGGY